MTCGLLQKSGRRFLGHSRFYEEQYQAYYERPGIEQFDRGRYVAMAEWMRSALGNDFVPQSVLDVGCGAGWSMQATKGIYPDAVIAGIEPSPINAAKARLAGFCVAETRLGETTKGQKYDLIYSVNVLQHVIDPVNFCRYLIGHLTEHGRIVLILPDASVPSHELLWSDHNFSFRPKDLLGLANRAGLQVLNWEPNPPNNSLLNKQIVVMTRIDSLVARDICPETPQSADELFAKRSSYLASWQTLDRELVQRIAGNVRIFNFGASMWTWLLAGYCPSYWRSVAFCLVDGGAGQCVGKSVASPADIEFADGDCIVLGINPVNQGSFKEKLRGRGIKTVGWADLIGS
jgi:2-polyprenyl-3-methyl-5-hydroxy-6-metoxy-1,4-benzoquinol methylase